MLKVGLTGGIATGKTAVGAMFVDLGCHLIDSDLITHQLLEPGQRVYGEVVQAFGSEILAENGRIDRSKLGAIVFSRSERRETLNRIVHPAVIVRQVEFLERVSREAPSGIAIVDAALMIETGSFRRYDYVIVVTCKPELQHERLRIRLGLTDQEIEDRIASQMPLEEKTRYADFIIDNSGSLDETRRRVEEVYRELVRVSPK